MNEKKPSRPTDNSAYKYTGMAFQMLVPIVAGFVGGFKLDNYLGNKIPVFTLILGLLGIAGGLYLAIKDFIKK